MDDCLAKDGESLTKRQKVKFEGKSESERGPDDEGSKGWLLGDYKVGDINFAIASVTKERQVEKRKKKNMDGFKYCIKYVLWSVIIGHPVREAFKNVLAYFFR